MTYQEIADILGVSNTAVRKIERKAILKMQKLLGIEDKSIFDFLEFKHD